MKAPRPATALLRILCSLVILLSGLPTYLPTYLSECGGERRAAF